MGPRHPVEQWTEFWKEVKVMDRQQLDAVMTRVRDFIKFPVMEDEQFGQIALELYDLHRSYNPVYAKYDRGPLTDWREIPLMPIGEYKRGLVGLEIETAMPFPGVEFNSSGTTQRDKSLHRMYDTEAYRASIAGGLSLFVDSDLLPKYRVIILSPELDHSSLYYMMQYTSELLGTGAGMERFDGMNDLERVSKFIEDLSWQVEDEPVIIFGTSLAFYDLVQSIEKCSTAVHKLPKGSMIIETGGWKGRNIEITGEQLTDKIIELFGLESVNAVREYSMSEISSQLWAWNNTQHYTSPPWLNVRMVDPLTQREVTEGETGIIAFVDLANVWSCPFILTEDMGHIYNGKVVLEGRAVSAPEKGCSLTYAEAMDS